MCTTTSSGTGPWTLTSEAGLAVVLRSVALAPAGSDATVPTAAAAPTTEALWMKPRRVTSFIACLLLRHGEIARPMKTALNWNGTRLHFVAALRSDCLCPLTCRRRDDLSAASVLRGRLDRIPPPTGVGRSTTRWMRVAKQRPPGGLRPGGSSAGRSVRPRQRDLVRHCRDPAGPAGLRPVRPAPAGDGAA